MSVINLLETLALFHKGGKIMAEVSIELSGSSWREPWSRSITIPAPHAKEVADWLENTLPDLIAHTKSGDFPAMNVLVKD